MDKYDTTQLTEFPRFEAESSQSGVSSFLNILWKLPLFSPSEGETSQSKAITDGKEKVSQGESSSVKEEEEKPETGSYAVELEGRSLPNVLRRISSLVALGSGGGTRYADTELARYWMPDDISRECYECATRFSTLRRRHHCRVCGQIFCSRCCSQRVPGHIFGCAGGLRVCTYCCNVVLSYLKENDMTGDISPDLKTLQENLQSKFPENKSTAANKGCDNFMLSRDQGERCEARATPKEALEDVYRQLSFTLPTQQHRYRLVRYNGVWRGCDILQWVMDNTDNKTRVQASQVCQSLLSQGYMECVSEILHFADYALYKPTVTPPQAVSEEIPPEAESAPRLVESVSSYCLDLNLGDNSARLTKAMRTEKKLETPPSGDENPVFEQNEAPSSPVCPAVAASGEDHLDLLMRQCLARRALPAAWRRLLPLCARAAAGVTPHMLSSDLDVRNYVQVKKVPGGDPSECCLIPGVVLTKNVTHRGMPQQITNPTVLLLDCSIAFQRVEGKLTTLEPILLQEQEYLMRCAARITALQPHVLLVRGSAARALQDALRAARLALAVGVRQRSLYRLARCLRADVVTSIDARIGTPRLGTAKNFYIKNYSSKTLMVLENCAEPNLGCCILLRGGSLAELTRLKKVIKFMVLACYNWRLEKALLGDLEATLPEAGTVFDDDENFEENIDKPSKDEENGSGDNVEEGKIDSDTKPKDEPPQSVKFIRKAEDKTLSVPVPDCSDPLRTTDDDVFLARDDVTLTAGDERTDRWCIDDAVLSMSPNVSLEPPAEPSRLLAPPPAPPAPPRAAPPPTRPQELHPFASTPLRAFADDPSVRSSLALFRAMGPPLMRDGRHMPTCPLYTAPPAAPSRPDTPDTPAPEPDPLAPENHQRLPLLLYSYSARSPNAPDFCVNPWTVTMEMYGRHDISLGGFLKKYCFDPEYKCPSGACTVPMNQHVRKFVHGDVCITITCNTIGHSNVDKEKEDQNKQITVWTRCGVCGSQSGPRVLSARARSVSLAVFLLVRARAARYVRRRCRHALRHAAIGIVCGLTAASVRFDKISTFEVSLPPEVIWTKYDTKQMRDALFNQLNELMLKAHETFSGESDSDAQNEYQSFKSHTESVQIALTSTRLQARGDPAAVVRSLWSISDRIIFAEKMLREAQDKWSSPLVKSNKVVTDNQVEEKPDIEEPINDSGITDSLDAASRDLDKEHAGAEEDEEKGDKKTVRQILTQLLSNNQTINQEGIILSSGVIPVVVLGGEIGSVIAASLASVTYQRAVRTKHTSQSELEEEATSSVGKDKSDTDKAKTKSNEHIEVLLKDGLVCRVYFAAQFQRLRHFVLRPLAVNPHVIDVFANKHEGRGERGERSEGAGGACGCDDGKERGDKNLCEIEEAFIRSLAHCVPWAARGGKSGSTFCKTKDDRYVLKEMTKAEWQVFLEFAPHYFNYITSCMQSKQPSLLARILGVYSVGGAGNGVLVMENVWYACAGARYDLKGSTRHRAAPPAAAVLLDHNLLSLRWDTQFYVSAEAGRELNALAARDTAFLTQHDVMDYSLLLAVDGRTLVVALIDYIRTFTWDKKLEHLVKKNLGSGSPTVVSPTQYRLRFLAALRKYFLPTPTHWDPVWCEEDKNKETN